MAASSLSASPAAPRLLTATPLGRDRALITFLAADGLPDSATYAIDEEDDCGDRRRVLHREDDGDGDVPSCLLDDVWEVIATGHCAGVEILAPLADKALASLGGPVGEAAAPRAVDASVKAARGHARRAAREHRPLGSAYREDCRWSKDVRDLGFEGYMDAYDDERMGMRQAIPVLADEAVRA